ncbi:hypothetical protein DH2020_010230 [Rehmannia glutinosa]|uniref:SET domain-containing protein n=1 Tax=Rehmannia glutinosa TaxID=99300 RepID=A0ABR0XA27_REHGL
MSGRRSHLPPWRGKWVGDGFVDLCFLTIFHKPHQKPNSVPSMEKLKSVIPETLKQKITKSATDDLHSTSSSLLHFFQTLPLFHQMVRDLTDPEIALCGKNKEAALEAKGKGNECFSKGDYSSALHFYSQALRIAPLDVEDKGKNLVAMLYLNRASSLHKLGFFLESLRDCSRALIVSPAYAKAWFWRAKANSSLGNHEDAISDLNVSLKIETSLSGKRQIESELNKLLDQSRLRSNAMEKPNNEISELAGLLFYCQRLQSWPCSSSVYERLQMDLQCVSTTTKGRGMVSSTDIPLASLIHKEDPYAAILLKHCRETHCAFCFNELPADTVPCVSCSIPVYCSLKCQVQAGGQDFPKCMHWAAVLPSDVVLAGRILVKHIEQQSSGGVDPKIHGILDLCQNYGQLSPETKLEFHVYSIILLHCLQQFYASNLPSNSAMTSEIIMLLSKIRVNSMAVVRMKYSDGKQPLDYDVTSSVEQVQVAQAVYCGGSLFNHSCLPNVHAYFLSRTLFIRATENVAAGSELELSYGPQVGEWDCSERRRFLEDRYSFICQCSGCAQLNLSDLVHTGYRCIKPNCFGVVLNSCVAKYEQEKLKHFKGPNSLQGYYGISKDDDSCEKFVHPHLIFVSCGILKEYMVSDDNIGRVARHIFEQTDYRHCFEPGCCLSCGSSCDIRASQKTIAGAEIYIQRLQDAVASGEIATNLITDALKSIDILRIVLHPFNKRIAEVEDNIAQAFCLIGELQAALDHCQASIEILETLYGENHIVIGNELIKLASIRHSMGHKSAANDTSRMVSIFSRYYGSHADIIFPHLRYLKREASSLV